MNVKVMVRTAHAAVLCALVILATAPTPVNPANDALIPTPSYEVTVEQQVADFPCTLAPKGVWPKSALVVTSKPIKGGVRNESIVRAESFEVAFAHAKAHTVWIIKWCK